MFEENAERHGVSKRLVVREGRFASNTAVATLLAGVARGMEAVHAHTNPNPNP